MIPEFSRPVRIDSLTPTPRSHGIAAEPGELKRLAGRFSLVAIERLEAEAQLSRNGDDVIASGSLSAAVVQSCAATSAPVPAEVHEEFRIVFRPQPVRAGEEDEIELGSSDLDVVFYEGSAIDLGEAVAETLSLALEPYPRAPDADEALRAAGVKNEEEAGVFGALAALRDKLK